MGFNNPSVTWSEMERLLSGRAKEPDVGDGPAFSRKRGKYEPPPIERPTDPVPYAELHAHSSYSFLDGASSPAELAEEAGSLRETLMEYVAETDDELIEKFLEEGELTDEELDVRYPAFDEDERPIEGETISVREMLVEHGDRPGWLCGSDW